MIKVQRFEGNPILSPNPENFWEKEAAFNGCPVSCQDKYQLLYRAISGVKEVDGVKLEVSTIGCATSPDRIDFSERRQLIKPEHEWEKFGCEDPRVTKFGKDYYIFYTALSTYPFRPEGIRIGLALTQDFQSVKEKYLVTTFNSKAMTLFPEKINGKIAAILTANTDLPPSSIGIALFNNQEEITNPMFWQEWYSQLEDQSLHLLRSLNDQIEIGAPPIKTAEGWLLIYCYIQNYRYGQKIFGIEAALLDLENPFKVIGATREPLLIPERDYELYGKVSQVIFPSGALIAGNELGIYYGAADTSCCLATCSLNELLLTMKPRKSVLTKFGDYKNIVSLYPDNPIIEPIPEHKWESQYTFNPAAVYYKGKIHILYRAMGQDNTSVLGYASSRDGLHIDERISSPAYYPRENFEKKSREDCFSGCEDPRITSMDDRFLMCYTAYDGHHPPRVAFTSILKKDFAEKIWSWTKPKLISSPHTDDKNACVLEEKIKGKYFVFHRLHSAIWIDQVESLDFSEGPIRGKILMHPRQGWESEKVGIGPPPIKTSDGWLLIYHALCREDREYRLGAVLLDLDDPFKIISRLDYPILEPEEDCSRKGQRTATVFACGAVAFEDEIYLYYGGADSVVCVATINKNNLVKLLKKSMTL